MCVNVKVVTDHRVFPGYTSIQTSHLRWEILITKYKTARDGYVDHLDKIQEASRRSEKTTKSGVSLFLLRTHV